MLVVKLDPGKAFVLGNVTLFALSVKRDGTAKYGIEYLPSRPHPWLPKELIEDDGTGNKVLHLSRLAG